MSTNAKTIGTIVGALVGVTGVAVGVTNRKKIAEKATSLKENVTKKFKKEEK